MFIHRKLHLSRKSNHLSHQHLYYDSHTTYTCTVHYLNTISFTRPHTRPCASAWRAHVSIIQILPRLPVVPFRTRLTTLTSGIVLTVDAHATTTSVAVPGEWIQGLIIVTASSVIVTLTLDTRIRSEGVTS
jgi:hypothetical protein